MPARKAAVSALDGTFDDEREIERHGHGRGSSRGRPRENRFFSIADVAEQLDVSTRTVRRWIERKKLVAHYFGAVVRIAESDLKAFLERHRHP